MPNSFSNLNLPARQLANLGQLGYRLMTPIQMQALPPALEGHDLIAQAKTGSGKTAVFAITLLAKLEPQDFNAQALVICPTRELSSQVATEIRRLARYQPNIKVLILCGGQPIRPQMQSLEHGAHIIVGTPGRITDHLQRRSLNLARINTLVLDEADRMLEMGFLDDIEKIIKKTPPTRQTLLFSATYPDDILSLSARFQRQPLRVQVDTLHHDNVINQRVYQCEKTERLQALLKLLSHFQPGSVVIFCNMKVGVREVTEFLGQQGFSVKALHGELEQRDRDEVFVQFRHQSFNLLVASDVAARGLDIEDLPCVINYDLPHDPEVYIHRIGRTGRAGNEGLALSLMSISEQRKLDDLCSYQNILLPAQPVASLPDTHFRPPQPVNVTLRIAAGRKDKLRPGDILGALTGTGGLNAKAIGKIDVLDYVAYVAIRRNVAHQALSCLLNGKLKGRKFCVRKL